MNNTPSPKVSDEPVSAERLEELIAQVGVDYLYVFSPADQRDIAIALRAYQLSQRGDDARRLDWLESMGNAPEGLLLHSQREPTCRLGLGLDVTGRSLRQAIDDAMPPALLSASGAGE